ncbi:TAXI family TRAP transporter solute-binding subunit [Aquisalimonas lutea]|uniref:TAXI family TRAP transporter solute-binding subunit n=1 Tax=Aquisalimonas lutea TaxID=1327750 RepID=UPI0025B5F251|nr:TAXI family TRAP transporter solute-binding subunit [Aquisalimonas lutea]MDN3516530.1 TAXI family TRAP transporter solute-binding subunit [Aquisalimonas lutea]
MNHKTQAVLTIVLGGALLVGGVAQAELNDPVDLRVASFREGSSWHVYSVTLGQMLREQLPAGSTIDTPPLGGGTANPSLIDQGKADIGLSFAVVNRWADDGVELFEERKENLRGLIGGLDQYYLGIIANDEDAEPTLGGYLEENPATRVMLLRRGSFGSYSGEQLLAELGVDGDELGARGGSLTFTGFNTIKEAFPAGRTDLFVQVMTRGHPAITEIAETADVTFLEPGEGTLNAMMDQYGWGAATLPAGTFRGQERELSLLGTTTALIASTGLSEEAAYAIVKTVCEDLDAFRRGHGALSEFDCETQAWRDENIGLPLHAGAERYYREQGWID